MQQLNELHVNGVGKLLFVSVAAWLAGKAVSMRIRASKQEALALAKAMIASKRFQQEISKPGATVDSVMKVLGDKTKSAREFEDTFNMRWPL
jgi:hypothetical protein